MSPKFRTAAAGLAAIGLLAIPASAMAKDASLVSTLRSPGTIDGKTYSPAEMQHKFAGKQLYFVLGSREEGAGAVAAFRTRAGVKAYLRHTGRAPQRKAAHAAYNSGQSVFYADAFLEGPSIAANNNSALGNLADYCMISTLWWCNTSWDNTISSAKTGSTGAYLYNRPYNNTADGYVYLPSYDSVEVWRFFNDIASSVWVP